MDEMVVKLRMQSIVSPGMDGFMEHSSCGGERKGTFYIDIQVICGITVNM